MPDLRMCSECGEYLCEVMYFLPQSGTVECGNCYKKGGEYAVMLNSSAMTALRHTIYAEDKKLFSFALPDRELEMVNQASESYLKYMFEKDFKTLNFYKMMI